MTNMERRARRRAARACTVATAIAIGTMLGGGMALASGGDTPAPVAPAVLVPQNTYMCKAAENAAADALNAAHARVAADATAAADKKSAEAALALVKSATDSQAAPEILHAANVQAAMATQAAEASQNVATGAAAAQAAADTLLNNVKACNEVNGNVSPPIPLLPPEVPTALVPVVPLIPAGGVPGLPFAGTPAGGPAGIAPADTPVSSPAVVAADQAVKTPGAEVVTGRNPSEALRETAGAVMRWATVAAWLILLATGIVLVAGRRRKHVAETGHATRIDRVLDRAYDAAAPARAAAHAMQTRVRAWYGAMRG